MKFFIHNTLEADVTKFIVLLIIFIFKLFYRPALAVDDASNSQLLEDDDEEENDLVYIPTLSSHYYNQTRAANNHPESLTTASVSAAPLPLLSCQKKHNQAATARKLAFTKRRKFFRNAILMHELIKRKDFMPMNRF